MSSMNFAVEALRNGVALVERSDDKNEQFVLASSIEMAALGFKIMPKDLFYATNDSLLSLLDAMRVVTGADRNMKPVYPGFPKQVQDLPTLTLVIEQLLHYWSGGTLMPDYPEIKRAGLTLSELSEPDEKVLRVENYDDFARATVSELVSVDSTPSENKMDLFSEAVIYMSITHDEAVATAKKIRNGYVLQRYVVVATLLLDLTADEAVRLFAPNIKNIDHVLRVFLSLATNSIDESNNDAYNKAVTNLVDKNAKLIRVKNLSKPARRVVLERLGALTKGYNLDRVVGHRNLWRRVLRMMHPYSMKISGDTKRALDVIHENVKHTTFNSIVESLMANRDLSNLVPLLAEHQPGNLLRRLVALLRIADSIEDVQVLAEAVQEEGTNARLSTLISAYNGVASVNFDAPKLVKVTGLNNAMIATDHADIDEAYLTLIKDALKSAITSVLGNFDAPAEKVVATSSTIPVPLITRDTASSDRIAYRGMTTPLGENGNILRLFNHWRNNTDHSGYIDTAATLYDEDYKLITTVSWNSHMQNREIATYSGDTLVRPGKEASEYIDIDLEKVTSIYPEAKWVALSLYSYSSIPFGDVDVISGAMMRAGNGETGEVFDPRTATATFKPTTDAYQSLPLAVNLITREMVWLDESSGATQDCMSSSTDSSLDKLLKIALERPALTVGELMSMYAEAHNIPTDDTATAVVEDAIELINK